MKDSSRINEAATIFKKLTPQNQAYLMVLVRMAEVAERNAKKRSADSRGK